MIHRCAVCWQRFISHGLWITHVRAEHDAYVGEWDPCLGEPKRGLVCIGIEHARKLRAEGKPVVRRPRPEPQPFVAPDGTIYTPQRLLT